jgi:hypothetical protein
MQPVRICALIFFLRYGRIAFNVAADIFKA